MDNVLDNAYMSALCICVFFILNWPKPVNNLLMETLPSSMISSTHSEQNIKNTLHLCPQNSLISQDKVSKAFHRDVGPCSLQCFPQQCQVDRMSFGWGTILDTHRKLLSVKIPATLQFLTQTGAPETYYHTLFKTTSVFCLAHSPSEWHTYTIHVPIVSRLKKYFF